MAKTVAKIQIEGIHCVDGCGDQIRAPSAKLPACLNHHSDFNAENPVNLVGDLDPAGCNGQEMIRPSRLDDGKYTVSMEVINYEAGN